MRRFAFSFVFVVIFAAGAQSALAKGPLKFFGLEFPAKLAGTSLGSHKDFEKPVRVSAMASNMSPRDGR